MQYSPQPICHDNNADPHGVCGTAVLVLSKGKGCRESYISCIMSLINLKKKKILKTKI